MKLIGVDVGGTFTDLVLAETDTAQVVVLKVPTTPEDPSIGVTEGVIGLCAIADIDPSEIDQVLHGGGPHLVEIESGVQPVPADHHAGVGTHSPAGDGQFGGSVPRPAGRPEQLGRGVSGQHAASAAEPVLS